MDPTSNAWCNDVYRGPTPGIFDLPCRRETQDGYPVVLSWWKPTAEELEQVARGGVIQLGIFGESVSLGVAFPPGFGAGPPRFRAGKWDDTGFAVYDREGENGGTPWSIGLGYSTHSAGYMSMEDAQAAADQLNAGCDDGLQPIEVEVLS